MGAIYITLKVTGGKRFICMKDLRNAVEAVTEGVVSVIAIEGKKDEANNP